MRMDRRKATPVDEDQPKDEVPLDSEGLPDFEALERLGNDDTNDDDDDEGDCEIVGAVCDGVQVWAGESVQMLNQDGDDKSEEVFQFQFREEGGR